MRRSKLETCMDILETLARYGPLKITHIMQKANLNSNVLKNYFAFLIKQGAIEGRRIGRDKIVYMITERGLYLTQCFIELNHVIPTGKIFSEIPFTKAKNELIQCENKPIFNPKKIVDKLLGTNLCL